MTLAKKIIITVLSLFLFLILTIVSGVIFFEFKYKNSFYPGVSIAGESVAGKKYDDVLQYFKEKSDRIQKFGLDVYIDGINGQNKINIPISYNGLTSDRVVEYFSLGNIEDVIKKAYSFGREKKLVDAEKQKISGFFHQINFIFQPFVQTDSVESLISDNSKEFLKKTLPATFYFNKDELTIKPEIYGEKINLPNLENQIKSQLTQLNYNPINIKTEQETPSSTQADLNKFKENALSLSQLPGITFTYNENTWPVSGKIIATWVAKGKDGKMIADRKKVQNYFNQSVAIYIDSPMQNSRFEIRNNKLIEISKGFAGNNIDLEKNAQKIDAYINDDPKNNNQKKYLEVETTIVEPKITKETINKYNIKELVGSSETNFSEGSLDRQHNIEVGVSKLNGILLAPGEEFSAVNAIGDITEEAGFVKEYVIKDGKTEKEIGGGLCQIATTLFRLAVNSGLPIVERINHRYVISYYGAGLDATIYGPHPDLRFINDTDNYLLLQGKTENNKVTLEFYGEKDGRIVKISEPKLYNKTLPPSPKYSFSEDVPLGKTRCTEIPHNGITADVEYNVTYPDGQTKTTNFHSVYQPWQKVCLIGIGN